MEHRRKNYVRTAKALVIAIFVVFLLNLSAVAQNTRLDGTWWRDLHAGERVEFLAGFIDCYANDLGDKNNTFPDSWDTYAPRITQYYDSHPQKIARPVIRVLFEVRSPHPPKPPEGGEVWTEKHWFFNGDYWGQMSRYEQIAYIDGYLSCYRKYLPSRPRKFSKSSEVYAIRISRWFDAEPSKSPKLIVKRGRIAIADVLYKLADGLSAQR